MTPLKSIRKKCMDCTGGSTKEIRYCEHSDCDFYNNRFGTGGGRYLKLIRKFCLWCCNGVHKEIALCTCNDCPLHRFRFGKNPSRVRKDTLTDRCSINVVSQG